jgi:hypothetical protein
VKVLKRFERVIEAIADPGFRDDIFGAIRIEFDLLTQIFYEHPKIIDLIAMVGTPNSLQKLSV